MGPGYDLENDMLGLLLQRPQVSVFVRGPEFRLVFSFFLVRVSNNSIEFLSRASVYNMKICLIYFIVKHEFPYRQNKEKPTAARLRASVAGQAQDLGPSLRLEDRPRYSRQIDHLLLA